MRPTVYVALFGWPLLALVLFSLLRPRRAVLASMILGWLFLPVASIKFASGIPEYSKIMAVCLGTLLGVVVFDLRRLLAFRPHWADLPMAIWCLSPFASSITNDLGPYDGMSAIFLQTVEWGLPYLFGRLYCSNLRSIGLLAFAVFLGGLIYIPFCLFEIRMSPQLHTWLYGFHQHFFNQSYRFGGWRPTVFMHHGIMVGLWMAMASLSGIWLWMAGGLRTLFRIPLPWFLGPLLVTTVLCKALGGLVLLVVGLAVLLSIRWGAPRAAILALALFVPLYCAIRIPRVWSGSELTDVSALVSSERASSLKFRLMNEDMLLERASLRPVFGWARWGRARVRDDMGRDISITDGLWIIVFGNQGLVGLFAMMGVFLAPVAGLWRAIRPSAWKHPLAAPAAAMCVMGLLFFVDNIFNDMNHPVYMIAIGGLSCLTAKVVRKPRPVPAPTEKAAWAPQS
jgi:hypothetical protein